eukprot:2724563-Rhodomonas_salina.3
MLECRLLCVQQGNTHVGVAVLGAASSRDPRVVYVLLRHSVLTPATWEKARDGDRAAAGQTDNRARGEKGRGGRTT